MSTFTLEFLLKQKSMYNHLMISYQNFLNLVGSTNGLVCFSFMLKISNEEEEKKYQHLIVVWNPVTTQFRITPKPKSDSNIPFEDQDEKDDIISCQLDGHLTTPLIVFSFVGHNDDHGMMISTEYKLARVFARVDHKKTIVFRAQVFLQNMNSWEPVKNQLELSSVDVTSDAISSNGFMYWKVTLEGDKSGVISFDMQCEVFSAITLEIDWEAHNLFTWKDSLVIATVLHLAARVNDDFYLILWTMKDSVWSKLCCVDTWNIPLGHEMQLVGLWKDQFFIIIPRDEDDAEYDYLCRASLVSYDLKTKTIEENILCSKQNIDLHEDALIYVPTLAAV